MNPTKLLSACALFALAGTSNNLLAAIDITDSATYYNAENWYGYRSNTNVEYSSTSDSINFSKLDSSSYVWGYFNPITLSVGDALTFTGTFTFGTIASGGIFSIGFFNSGLCSQSQMITHTYQSGTDVSSMANYTDATSVIAAATGGMAGVSANNTKAFLRTKTTSNTAFLSTATGAQQTTETFETAYSAPTAEAEYLVSLELTKTDTGLDFAVSFNGETTQTISFETEISTFDVIGIRSPVTAGGSGITLTNLSISTTGTIIPEPSTFCLMGGGLSLALLALRRKRAGARRSRV